MQGKKLSKGYVGFKGGVKGGQGYVGLDRLGLKGLGLFRVRQDQGYVGLRGVRVMQGEIRKGLRRVRVCRVR